MLLAFVLLAAVPLIVWIVWPLPGVMRKRREDLRESKEQNRPRRK